MRRHYKKTQIAGIFISGTQVCFAAVLLLGASFAVAQDAQWEFGVDKLGSQATSNGDHSLDVSVVPVDKNATSLTGTKPYSYINDDKPPKITKVSNNNRSVEFLIDDGKDQSGLDMSKIKVESSSEEYFWAGRSAAGNSTVEHVEVDGRLVAKVIFAPASFYGDLPDTVTIIITAVDNAGNPDVKTFEVNFKDQKTERAKSEIKNNTLACKAVFRYGLRVHDGQFLGYLSPGEKTGLSAYYTAGPRATPFLKAIKLKATGLRAKRTVVRLYPENDYGNVEFDIEVPENAQPGKYELELTYLESLELTGEMPTEKADNSRYHYGVSCGGLKTVGSKLVVAGQSGGNGVWAFGAWPGRPAATSGYSYVSRSKNSNEVKDGSFQEKPGSTSKIKMWLEVLPEKDWKIPGEFEYDASKQQLKYKITVPKSIELVGQESSGRLRGKDGASKGATREWQSALEGKTGKYEFVFDAVYEGGYRLDGFLKSATILSFTEYEFKWGKRVEMRKKLDKTQRFTAEHFAKGAAPVIDKLSYDLGSQMVSIQISDEGTPIPLLDARLAQPGGAKKLVLDKGGKTQIAVPQQSTDSEVTLVVTDLARQTTTRTLKIPGNVPYQANASYLNDLSGLQEGKSEGLAPLFEYAFQIVPSVDGGSPKIQKLCGESSAPVRKKLACLPDNSFPGCVTGVPCGKPFEVDLVPPEILALGFDRSSGLLSVTATDSNETTSRPMSFGYRVETPDQTFRRTYKSSEWDCGPGAFTLSHCGAYIQQPEVKNSTSQAGNTAIFNAFLTTEPTIDYASASSTVTDFYGNKATASRNFLFPTIPPEITLSHTLYEGSYGFFANFYDRSGMDLASLTMQVNGKDCFPIVLSAGDEDQGYPSTAIRYCRAELGEGAHTYSASGADRYGLQVSQSKSLSVAFKPVIDNFSLIGEGLDFTQPVSLFTAQVSDAGNDLDRSGFALQLDGQSIPAGQIQFDESSGALNVLGPLNIGDGLHRAILIVADTHGNTANAKLSFSTIGSVSQQSPENEVLLDSVAHWELQNSNGDGLINPGELIRLIPAFSNAGVTELRGLRIQLEIDDPDIIMERPEALMKRLLPGQSRSIPGGFDLRISADILTRDNLNIKDIPIRFLVSDEDSNEWELEGQFRIFEERQSFRGATIAAATTTGPAVPLPPDPTIQITSPMDGDAPSFPGLVEAITNVTISGTFSEGDSPFDVLNLRVENLDVGTTSFNYDLTPTITGPGQFSVTLQLIQGEHEIVASIETADGDREEHQITLLVFIPDPEAEVTITSPVDGDTIDIALGAPVPAEITILGTYNDRGVGLSTSDVSVSGTSGTVTIKSANFNANGTFTIVIEANQSAEIEVEIEIGTEDGNFNFDVVEFEVNIPSFEPDAEITSPLNFAFILIGGGGPPPVPLPPVTIDFTGSFNTFGQTIDEFRFRIYDAGDSVIYEVTPTILGPGLWSASYTTGDEGCLSCRAEIYLTVTSNPDEAVGEIYFTASWD